MIPDQKDTHSTRRTLLRGLLALGLAGMAGCGREGAIFPRPASPSRPSLSGLDPLQLGHLQHIRNLADRPDGDWSLMGADDTEQAGLSSYRYQLAYMAYALATAHYHYLPAAPGVFKSAYENIMRKMLRYDVWSYWYDTSRSGPRLDPDMKTLRDPWRDPVRKENIMYSGHVLAMAGLYEMLFGDDRYSRPGGLTFEHKPMFWGDDGFTFEYSFTSLKNVIFLEMLQNGWLGVACEPNNIFIVCNQFPMLGFRFHDICHASADADFATASYRSAWERRGGFLSEDNSIISTLLVRQEVAMPPMGLDWDAWTGSALNAWAPDYARELFSLQADQYFRKHRDGRVSLYPKTVLSEVRARRAAGEADPDLKDPAFRYSNPSFGYAAVWLSELGDTERLAGLLSHADRYFSPTWDKGGLYYPRNDTSWDADGEMVFMEPFTGNTLIGYARINPPGGLNAIYENPWTSEQRDGPSLANNPANIQVTRAVFERSTKRLDLCIEPISGLAGDTLLRIEKSLSQNWRLSLDGEDVSTPQTRRTNPAGSIARETGDGAIEIALAPRKATTISLTW